MPHAKIFGAEESLLDAEDRRESGPHIALSVISPYMKSTCVDDELPSRTPIIRFVGYNWHLGKLGPSSYGKLAGSSMGARLANFDQVHPDDGRLFLNTSSTKRVPTTDDLGLSPQSMTERAVPAPDMGRTCTDVDIDPDVRDPEHVRERPGWRRERSLVQRDCRPEGRVTIAANHPVRHGPTDRPAAVGVDGRRPHSRS